MKNNFILRCKLKDGRNSTVSIDMYVYELFSYKYPNEANKKAKEIALECNNSKEFQRHIIKEIANKKLLNKIGEIN